MATNGTAVTNVANTSVTDETVVTDEAAVTMRK